MTQRKPKPLGTQLEVAEGAQVVRPGTTEAITVTGGLYTLDAPGVHIIDGNAQPVGDDTEA